MKHFAALLFLWSSISLTAFAQSPPPVLPSPTMLPTTIYSAGGGFASPNGKFAYASVSRLALPQQTYVTGAIEYTMINGTIQTCPLGGFTKPIYQLSIVTVGMTGLGGVCTNPEGKNTAAGSGQAFAYIRWGKLPIANVVTVMKNTDTGFKVTLGFAFGQ
jgi:hypothetical protein